MNNRGQALVEYVLIIALITLVAVASVRILGGYIKDAITKTTCSIMNQEYVQGEKAGGGTCKDTVLE